MSRKNLNAVKNAKAHAAKKERRPAVKLAPLAQRVLDGDMPLPKGARGKKLAKQVKALRRHIAAQAEAS